MTCREKSFWIFKISFLIWICPQSRSNFLNCLTESYWPEKSRNITLQAIEYKKNHGEKRCKERDSLILCMNSNNLRLILGLYMCRLDPNQHSKGLGNWTETETHHQQQLMQRLWFKPNWVDTLLKQTKIK